MRMPASNKAKSNGFSLIELMVTIALGFFIYLAAFKMYQTVRANAEVTESTQDIEQILGSLEALYNTSSSFSGVSTQYAITNGIVPENMLTQSNTQATFPFGGNLTLATPPSTSNAVSFQISNVPELVCTKLVEQFANKSEYIDIDGNAVKNIGGNFDPINAATYCGSAATHSVEFIFYGAHGWLTSQTGTTASTTGGVLGGPETFTSLTPPTGSSTTPATVPMSSASVLTPGAQSVSPAPNMCTTTPGLCQPNTTTGAPPTSPTLPAPPLPID